MELTHRSPRGGAVLPVLNRLSGNGGAWEPLTTRPLQAARALAKPPPGDMAKLKGHGTDNLQFVASLGTQNLDEERMDVWSKKSGPSDQPILRASTEGPWLPWSRP